MSIDLSQFHQVFYEESFEGLDAMESALMALDPEAPDAETINTIFRSAHSIKGGSATFGFSMVAGFTHVLETLLDEIRDGKRPISRNNVDLFLQSVDCLRDMLTSLQAGEEPDPASSAGLQQQFEAILAAAPDTAAADSNAATNAKASLTSQSEETPEPAVTADASALAAAEPGYWKISFRPHADMLRTGNEPLRMFRELASMGELSVTANLVEVPDFGLLHPEQCHVSWLLTLPDSVSREQIDEVFEWVLDEADISISLHRGAVDTVSRAGWHIDFVPGTDILRTGNEPLRLLRELAELGELEVTCCPEQVPTLAAIEPELCYLQWQLTLLSDCTREQVAEVFEWIADESSIQIEPLSAASTGRSVPDTDADTAADSFDAVIDGAGAMEGNAAVASESAVALALVPASKPDGAVGVANTTVSTAATVEANNKDAASSKAKAPAKVNAEAGSIRVGIDKIDNLINMVGELVITQSMLGQLGSDFTLERLPQLMEGLSQLEQNTRELQESVMRIRMLPISFAFSRFPRMVRDLSQRLGKSIRLELRGEQTELDKTVMEKIGDPLVHLVRNAVDHGIEEPDRRQAAGKPAEGVITLNAYHQGGNVVIEIDDDGKGLNRDKILSKAIEKNLVAEKDIGTMSDEQVFDLIFAPGFSTADQVSDVSGRGVGMDVVRRNIQELNGAVEIRSREGKGSRITIRLPLTLAILDGQLVKVGTHTYIFPLVAIVESLQLNPELINCMAGGCDVFQLRNEYVPIIRLYEIFDIVPGSKAVEESLLVVVECEGEKVGIVVDDLLAQQQVVIKSLEQNYRRVEGVSGATILGDGRVALILDIPGLVKLAGDVHRVNSRVANLSVSHQQFAMRKSTGH